VHQTGREEATTFWAGCGAIRRDVFLGAGGFDEGYRRPSIEDIELGGRLRRAGHGIRLCKTLQAKHLKCWRAGSLLRSDIRDRALPWTALLLRQGHVVDDLNLSWPNRVAAAAVLALLGAIVAGWWWPAAWVVAAVLAATLLALNAPLYAFFRRKRGLMFALGCIAWHWLYLLYGAVAFALGFGAHVWGGFDAGGRLRA
jgi:GT2 family glycosyltransferase